MQENTIFRAPGAVPEEGGIRLHPVLQAGASACEPTPANQPVYGLAENRDSREQIRLPAR